MPHRVYNLALGIAGLLAVALLLLAGADLWRHSRRGAPWKQRLVSAGLLLLGALGFGSLGWQAGCTRKGADGSGVTTGGTPGGTPGGTSGGTPGGTSGGTPGGSTGGSGTKESSDPFKRIAAVTAEAAEIAAGNKGQYPFDRAGKKRLLAALDDARASVDELQRADEINEGEAGLWKQDLQQLSGKVARFRPTEMKMATCYQPMMAPLPKRVSLQRLKARLPLLQKMAAAGKLHPRVARKVLVQIEADLDELAKPGGTGRMPPDEVASIKKLLPDTQKVVAQIKARLGGAAGTQPGAQPGAQPGVQPGAPSGAPSGAKPAGTPGDTSALGATRQWQAIKEAWRVITPLAANSSKSTRAQRKEADEKMAPALAAVEELAKAGKLSRAEAGLLRSEAQRLQRDMRRSPPADFHGRCYRRAAFNPAAASLARINKRLPLLDKLLASKTLDPLVMARVLPSVERDLQLLADPEERRRLRPEQARKVHGARLTASVLLKKIKRRLEEQQRVAR